MWGGGLRGSRDMRTFRLPEFVVHEDTDINA